MKEDFIVKDGAYIYKIYKRFIKKDIIGNDTS